VIGTEGARLLWE